MKRTPLRPGKPPSRHARMRPRNARRAARAFERCFGSWSDAIRAMPCHRCGARRGVQAAHMVPRSRGGDRRDLLPMCATDHAWVDAHPEYRSSLVPVARALYAGHNPTEAT